MFYEKTKAIEISGKIISFLFLVVENIYHSTWEYCIFRTGCVSKNQWEQLNTDQADDVKINEPRHDKTCLRKFQTRPDTNRPAQRSHRSYLESLNFGYKFRDIILSKQRTTKTLIRLRRCAGWSAPLSFAYEIRHIFSMLSELLTKYLWQSICLFKKKNDFLILEIVYFWIAAGSSSIFSSHSLNIDGQCTTDNARTIPFPSFPVFRLGNLQTSALSTLWCYVLISPFVFPSFFICCFFYRMVFVMPTEPQHDKTNNWPVRPVRPAKTQTSLDICPVWSFSSLAAWRNIGSLATHWTYSENSDQTSWMPRLIWVFAGRTGQLLVLPCCGSNEPSHVIMALLVLRKLILQTHMYSLSVGLDV